MFGLLHLALRAPLILALSASLAFAQESQAPDHPLIPRFAGADVIGARDIDYDAMVIPLGPAYEDENGTRRLREAQEVEGKVTLRLYRAPAGKSVLQVYRNYERALAQAGFEPLFSCKGEAECGFYFRFLYEPAPVGPEYAGEMDEASYRFLAARRTGEDGETYALLLVYEHNFHMIRDLYQRTLIDLRVVDVDTLEDEMTVVTAGQAGEAEKQEIVTEPLPFTSEDLRAAIAETGRAAVHQIYFDTGSAEIRPESRPALEAIARLLRENPDLKVLLIGHTDNRGGLNYNMDLSHNRAVAVRDALVNEYGIDPLRLGAAGVGFLAPVASNATPEGRALNRRVELVEWPPDL
jgi:outer membrane protein OmpA-like peptidoglycan-associated protein